MIRLDKYWYDKNPIAWILFPLSIIFMIIVRVRQYCYETEVIEKVEINVPVIIVGNITVGGTGKTPLVIELCKLLKTQGFMPGVISRGYKSSNKTPRLVKIDDDPVAVGDEPILITQNTKCPVVVCTDRVQAANYLINNTNCDIVISDDGMQHYHLHRDMEIAVVDGDRLYGNNFFIPAGPLREPVSRHQTVDFVVYNGDSTSRYSFQIDIEHVKNIKTNEIKPLKDFRGREVNAIAGIGNPARFFARLKEHSIIVNEYPFADHYNYKLSDLPGNYLPNLMTQKDAIKCKRLGVDKSWEAIITVQLSDSLKQDFLSKVLRLKKKQTVSSK